MAKRIAVIGAGCSGLTAIKCCVDESLDPVCFERTDGLGGLWKFTEKVHEELGCVMRSTIINTSKEMMSFSDFPIPKEYPNFMHNTKVNIPDILLLQSHLRNKYIGLLYLYVCMYVCMYV